MIYNGVEVKEFESGKPLVFDPPKLMFVWDGDRPNPNLQVFVHAYVPKRRLKAVATSDSWSHCAEIPERPKPRRATHRELAKWLAQGNGEWKANNENFSRRRAYFDYTDDLAPVLNVLIRKWDDDDWREPTADYMGLEG